MKKIVSLCLIFVIILAISLPINANHSMNQQERFSLVSQPLRDTFSNNFSDSGVLSGNGRYVVFSSRASNLRTVTLTPEELVMGEAVQRDIASIFKIYRADTWGQSIELLSVSHQDNEPNLQSAIDPAISDDGELVVFSSDDGGLVGQMFPDVNVLLRNHSHSETMLVSQGIDGLPADGISWRSSMSGDGRYIVFESLATNLHSQDDNGTWDIYLYDLIEDRLELVSKTVDGHAGNDQSREAKISQDGRWITYSSFANDLAEGDGNETADIYLYDRESEMTTLVTQDNDAGAYFPSISANGDQIAFLTESPQWEATIYTAQTVLWDRPTGEFQLISMNEGMVADSTNYHPEVTRDGSAVFFLSNATNLPSSNGSIQLYKYDRASDLLSVKSQFEGVLANQDISDFSLNTDGSWQVFTTQTTRWLPARAYDNVYLRQEGLHIQYLPILFTEEVNNVEIVE